VADPPARLAVNNPSSREAQVAKQVTEKCPIDCVEFLDDIHLEQNARNTSGV
jgi:hypothetical protein